MDERPIRVMSFNVRGSFRDQGTPNAWGARAALNVGTIVRCAPDVVGFQEVQSGNLQTYGEALPHYDRVPGPEYGNRARPNLNAIFFDGERLRLLDAGGFWLSETPERHSSSWGSKAVRSANWAYFELQGYGPSFLHLNTHLDHGSAAARREGGRLILRRLAGLLDYYGESTPVVVTGDFNCRPRTPTYRNFMEAGFADTYLAGDENEGVAAHTFHGFRGSRYKDVRPSIGPRRIDWILLRDPVQRLRALRHSIVRDHDGETYPSDHYPVLADFAP